MAAQFSLVISASSGFCFRHMPFPRLARSFLVISSAICFKEGRRRSVVEVGEMISSAKKCVETRPIKKGKN